MKTILLAGATGNLGVHLFQELKQQGYYVKVLARNRSKATTLTPAPDEIFVADASEEQALKGVCDGVDVVISAIGKSLSLKDKCKATFRDVDFLANLNLLAEAEKAGVQQFLYISAFAAAHYPHLAYFKAHADFAEVLKQSPINHTILEPTALFSAFKEKTALASKGLIGHIGKGDKRINPVYEGEVACASVAAIGQPPQVIAIGGRRIYTRSGLIRLSCKLAGHKGLVPKIPYFVLMLVMPVIKLLQRNLYDKMAFFVEVNKEDFLAPPLGVLTLEEYFELEKQVA
ncbi:NAD(P)H-binding protein [Pontibacter qinzhouensis]|uniref:NAD(P)H-binding protein n=1 Tax=Pontibacter qinzhouensis TaxID=2603253 RepID=A0A5C8JHX2_9BACT|nr:NAD(P)H-binding protein [Pontibacter qinzhouensis]TXK36961.1 NAD(P)H-binding protein [Pontibacter qinzhouensis]